MRTKQWLLADGAEDKSPIYNLLPPDAIHRATDYYSLETAYTMSDAFIHDTRAYGVGRVEYSRYDTRRSIQDDADRNMDHVLVEEY